MSRKVLLDSDVGGCRGGSPRRCLLESSPCIFLGGFSSLLYRLDAELNAEAAEVASLYSKLDKAAAYCASAVKQRTCTLCSRK